MTFWTPVWLLDRDFDDLFEPPLNHGTLHKEDFYQSPKGVGNDGRQLPHGHRGKPSHGYDPEKYRLRKAQRCNNS